jgi:RNA polymerase sigma-70 factor (ECF subfamily)
MPNPFLAQGEFLLAAARAGSSAALGQVLEIYRPYLLELAARELDADLQAKAGASDLVQESLVEALRDFPKFRGTTCTELVAWIQQILHHNSASLVQRYRDTQKRDIRRELPFDDDRFYAVLCENLASDSTTPGSKALSREEGEQMLVALEQLPEEHRRVIELHHRERRSFHEIAELMGRSESAVRKLWLRALDRWQRELKPYARD